ncbi:MAG: phosphopantetheine-binding protein [Bacteroidales bacterium]|nr:phosphopantetheine-binding protein [Bacteroidales bacterium]
MNKDELIAKTNEVLSEEFEVEIKNMLPEADIKETLDLDSLSLVDMVALIEETFGVEIKGQDLSKIKTFSALYDFILAKLDA